MPIKGLGQDAAVHQQLPQSKVEKPAVEPHKYAAPIENKTRANENAFGSAIVKETLNRLFDQAAVSKAAPAKPPEPPLDYFEIDKQADELIKKHTSEGFFSSSLKTDDLGKELADLAKTDPRRAAALSDNILDKIAGSDKDEVAQSFVESMSPAELRAYAKTDEGKKSLEQLKNHLLSGSVHNDERDTAKRIDTALKSAELEKNPAFQKLDKSVQQQILLSLERNEKNPAAVDNLLNLIVEKRDPIIGDTINADFAKLSVDSQKALLQAYNNHSGDKVFVDSLKSLAGKADFAALSAPQQSKVIADLDKFANTESYKGREGGLFGIGGHKVSDEDRRYLLDNLGNSSIYSAANPGVIALRNTLDKVVSGDIKIETYSEPSDKLGRTEFGHTYSDDTIYVNKHPDANNDAVWGANKFTDTLVHETNHNQNPGGENGTPDQFLNEYRAFYTGYQAIGTTVDSGAQKDIIDNLVGGYKDIKKLYEKDKDFKKFIDDAKAGLDKTPPELIDPEQMRQKLLDAGFSSDYLNTPGNLDNH